MEQLFQDTQGQYLAASVKNGREEHMQTSAFMFQNIKSKESLTCDEMFNFIPQNSVAFHWKTIPWHLSVWIKHKVWLSQENS